MSIGDDTYVYRGRLPHLLRREKNYYVTFCTKDRKILPPGARTLTLASTVHDHGRSCWIDSVVVMPDHVHLIVMPYETVSLVDVLSAIKSASSHRVNRLLGGRGAVWQRESFDRLVRSGDNLDKKRQYIFDNPARKGLVDRWEDYPWIWTPYRTR